jgi:AhpD family alkylhydroperoxidase
MIDAPPTADADEGLISSSLPDPANWRSPVVQPHSSPVVERLFRRRTGLIPHVVPYVCPHSWGYRPFLFLMNPEVRAIDRRLASQICFVVARDNACRFCYGSFRTFLRVAGYSEAELDRLERDLDLDDGTETALLRFAVELSQGHLQDETTVGVLRASGYESTTIREVAGIASLSTLINRVATMLSVPLNQKAERFTTTWYFDLLQPVVQTLLSGWKRLGAASKPPLAPSDVDGPFAPWILHLQGTCVGHVVDDVITRWLTGESALPLRTKLLMLAVVARGLDGHALLDTVRDLLSDQCGASNEVLDTAVTHLRGDAVTALEADLLPLARASIRYAAGDVQQMVREKARDRSRNEIIDAVTTLGLCNALVRLRALAPLDA